MKKDYFAPQIECHLFHTDDILANSDVVIDIVHGLGWNGKEDETEFIPFAGF